MVEGPKPIPFTRAVTDPNVAPAGMRSPGGVKVTLAGSLLLRVTKIPPVGAGATSVTGNGADAPRPTVIPAGNRMATPVSGGYATVIVTVLLETPPIVITTGTSGPTGTFSGTRTVTW
jgi:hypothetical protein